MNNFKVGTKYINKKNGLTLKITKYDDKKKWYYFIETGMLGIATEKELKKIIEEMGYEKEK